jgi:aminoglycoside phosphotransferase (APT) family kinase protein
MSGRAATDPSPAREKNDFLADSDAIDFDRASLATYLKSVGLSYNPARPVRQFSGGFANRNYLVEVDAEPMVLRRPPAGELPRGAHDMAREHRILRALSPVFSLAPYSLHYCADPAVIGAPFQLLEYREGLIISGAQLPAGLPDGAAAMLASEMIEILGGIHSVDTQACGLGDLGRPSDFVPRTIMAWRDRGLVATQAASASGLVEEISTWLAAQRFAPRPPRLLHSDFKLDNLVLDPNSLIPRAVLDWDMGTRGDPLFDLATLLSYWAQPQDPPALVRLAMMPTATPGFGSRREAAELYGMVTGLEIGDLPALYVLALLKLGVVFLQLHNQWQIGAARSERYAEFGGQAIQVLVHAHDLTSRDTV